jgi:hypothetical protein
MRKYVLKSGLILTAIVGMFFTDIQKAHAVPCTLLYINPGGLTAVYDCGVHGLVTVVRPITIR